MYKVLKRTCWAIVLLIKPIVLWRSRLNTRDWFLPMLLRLIGWDSNRFTLIGHNTKGRNALRGFHKPLRKQSKPSGLQNLGTISIKRWCHVIKKQDSKGRISCLGHLEWNCHFISRTKFIYRLQHCTATMKRVVPLPLKLGPGCSKDD